VAFTLVIGLLAVGGIWLLLYSTSFGLGINDDSIAYIAGARSILEGQGYREAWLVSNGPVTHFPPGFPALLALIGYITGLDPLRGARLLNALLFGMNIALAGWLGWRMTGLRGLGVLVASLTLSSSSMLLIHSRAMSEPLFITLMLLSFVLFDLYFQNQNILVLVALGFLLGWAYLARYAALALLATIIAALFVLNRSRGKILKSVGVLALSGIPWILAWSVRNRVVGGSFTNRTLGWHPITSENWNLALQTVAEFFVPLRSIRKEIYSLPGFFETVFLLIGISLVVWVVLKAGPRIYRPIEVSRSEALLFVNALFVIAYLVLLITTMTLFDPATKFQVRILSPTYIPFLLLGASLGAWIWFRSPIIGRFSVTLVSVAILLIFFNSQAQFVQDLRLGGRLFAGERWSNSDAIAVLNELPEDVLILSNEPGVVYLYTGRPSAILPKSEPGISQIKQPVIDGRIVLILFKVNKADAQTLDYYYALGSGLYLTDFSNAWLFTAFPE
jgi:hypothetical protein